MRKHNKRFAQRWGRDRGDRSNFPQVMAHGFVHGKSGQLVSNGLLVGLLASIGIRIPGGLARKST